MSVVISCKPARPCKHRRRQRERQRWVQYVRFGGGSQRQRHLSSPTTTTAYLNQQRIIRDDIYCHIPPSTTTATTTSFNYLPTDLESTVLYTPPQVQRCAVLQEMRGGRIRVGHVWIESNRSGIYLLIYCDKCVNSERGCEIWSPPVSPIWEVLVEEIECCCWQM